MKSRKKKRSISRKVDKNINKKLLTGEFIVLGIFVIAIFLLVIFGNRLTGLGFTGFAVADNYEGNGNGMNKLEIQVNNNNYYPGDDVNFKIILYDENTNKINGEINYEIRNYYTDIMDEGVVNSGEEKSFKLPENAIRGHWGILAKYNGIEKEELFTVQELEKAEIKLEQDKLIISNVGNTVYGKPISISIGNQHQTALVSLEIGQTKEIRLTAPAGEYDIQVSDGTNENTFEVKGVSLTGNVIGLEKVGSNFWTEYPLVILFLVAIGLVVIVIVGLRLQKRFLK